MGYMLSNLEYHDMQSNFQCYTAIYLFQHPQAGTSTKLVGLYCIGLPNTCAALINSPAKHVPANARFGINRQLLSKCKFPIDFSSKALPIIAKRRISANTEIIMAYGSGFWSSHTNTCFYCHKNHEDDLFQCSGYYRKNDSCIRCCYFAHASCIRKGSSIPFSQDLTYYLCFICDTADDRHGPGDIDLDTESDNSESDVDMQLERVSLFQSPLQFIDELVDYCFSRVCSVFSYWIDRYHDAKKEEVAATALAELDNNLFIVWRILKHCDSATRLFKKHSSRFTSIMKKWSQVSEGQTDAVDRQMRAVATGHEYEQIGRTAKELKQDIEKLLASTCKLTRKQLARHNGGGTALAQWFVCWIDAECLPSAKIKICFKENMAQLIECLLKRFTDAPKFAKSSKQRMTDECTGLLYQVTHGIFHLSDWCYDTISCDVLSQSTMMDAIGKLSEWLDATAADFSIRKFNHEQCCEMGLSLIVLIRSLPVPVQLSPIVTGARDSVHEYCRTVEEQFRLNHPSADSSNFGSLSFFIPDNHGRDFQEVDAHTHVLLAWLIVLFRLDLEQLPNQLPCAESHSVRKAVTSSSFTPEAKRDSVCVSSPIFDIAMEIPSCGTSFQTPGQQQSSPRTSTIIKRPVTPQRSTATTILNCPVTPIISTPVRIPTTPSGGDAPPPNLVCTPRSRRISRILLNHGFCVLRVKGDGHCFYRALSIVLLGREELYMNLREKVANHVLSRFYSDVNFRDFVNLQALEADNITIDELITGIRSHRYGGIVEGRAVTELFKAYIILYIEKGVLNSEDANMTMEVYSEGVLSCEPKITVRLLHVNNNHFDLLVPKDQYAHYHRCSAAATPSGGGACSSRPARRVNVDEDWTLSEDSQEAVVISVSESAAASEPSSSSSAKRDRKSTGPRRPPAPGTPPEEINEIKECERLRIEHLLSLKRDFKKRPKHQKQWLKQKTEEQLKQIRDQDLHSSLRYVNLGGFYHDLKKVRRCCASLNKEDRRSKLILCENQVVSLGKPHEVYRRRLNVNQQHPQIGKFVQTELSRCMNEINSTASKEVIEARYAKRTNFTFDAIDICDDCFICIYGIGRSTFFEYQKKSREGVQNWHHGNTGRLKPYTKTAVACASVLKQINAEGETLPTAYQEGHVILPKLKKQITADANKDLVTNDLLRSSGFKSLSRTTVQRALKQVCPNVKTNSRHTMAHCTECHILKAAIQKASAEEKPALEEKYLQHQRAHIGERKYMDKNIADARSKPREYGIIVLDGMDQSKTDLPHANLRHNNKRFEMQSKLGVRVTAAVVYGLCGPPRIYTYLSYAQETSVNANLTATIVVDILQKSRNGVGWKDKFSNEQLDAMNLPRKEEYGDHLALPATVKLQLDNTCKENKNNTVFATAAYLVKSGVMDEFHVNFLIKDHTHNICDQYFSRLSKHLLYNNVFTADDMCEAFSNAYQVFFAQSTEDPHYWDFIKAEDERIRMIEFMQSLTMYGLKPHVEVLRNVCDFMSWIQPRAEHIRGITKPQHFRICHRLDNMDNDVVVYSRQYGWTGSHNDYDYDGADMIPIIEEDTEMPLYRPFQVAKYQIVVDKVKNDDEQSSRNPNNAGRSVRKRSNADLGAQDDELEIIAVSAPEQAGGQRRGEGLRATVQACIETKLFEEKSIQHQWWLDFFADVERRSKLTCDTCKEIRARERTAMDNRPSKKRIQENQQLRSVANKATLEIKSIRKELQDHINSSPETHDLYISPLLDQCIKEEVPIRKNLPNTVSSKRYYERTTNMLALKSDSPPDKSLPIEIGTIVIYSISAEEWPGYPFGMGKVIRIEQKRGDKGVIEDHYSIHHFQRAYGKKEWELHRWYQDIALAKEKNYIIAAHEENIDLNLDEYRYKEEVESNKHWRDYLRAFSLANCATPKSSCGRKKKTSASSSGKTKSSTVTAQVSTSRRPRRAAAQKAQQALQQLSDDDEKTASEKPSRRLRSDSPDYQNQPSDSSASEVEIEETDDDTKDEEQKDDEWDSLKKFLEPQFKFNIHKMKQMIERHFLSKNGRIPTRYVRASGCTHKDISSLHEWKWLLDVNGTKWGEEEMTKEFFLCWNSESTVLTKSGNRSRHQIKSSYIKTINTACRWAEEQLSIDHARKLKESHGENDAITAHTDPIAIAEQAFSKNANFLPDVSQRARLDRALENTLGLLLFNKINDVEYEFRVWSGLNYEKVYKVIIAENPSCDCEDYTSRSKRKQCKHILFVLRRVLNVTDFPTLFKSVWTENEIKQLINSSANAKLFSNLTPANQNEIEMNNNESTTVLARELAEDDVCCICYVSMDVKQNLVWCKAMCGNNLHLECFRLWETSRSHTTQTVTCPHCRSKWMY